MKKYTIAFHAFLLSLVFPVVGYASTINARIVDLSGQPIPDVLITVKVSGFNNGVIETLTTDITGQAKVSLNNSGGSSCNLLAYSFTPSKPNYQFSHESVLIPCGPASSTQDLLIRGTTLPKLSSVSAANYQTGFTSNMIVASFGDGLATTTEAATSLPLKTTLGGRRILVTDSAGTEKAAGLVYVSPSQINYITPPDLAIGVATAKLVDENGNLIKLGFLNSIALIAPSIFTANADGKGVPAAFVLRSSTGFQVYEPVAQFDAATQQYVPVEIDLGSSSTEVVILVMFGTGWRKANAAGVSAYIGPYRYTDAVEYLGPQPTFEGLDQINIRLDRGLMGRGDTTVDLRFDSERNRANLVQIKIK